jgi:hypothetical protein
MMDIGYPRLQSFHAERIKVILVQKMLREIFFPMT